jgi:hypothetical protein
MIPNLTDKARMVLLELPVQAMDEQKERMKGV